jgi:ubiquinone/menaquinone biosynthesis C-methylase UbiE
MADQQTSSPNAREVQYWNSARTRAWADEYEAIDRLFAGLTRVALDHAAPKLGERVIDVGCGSGTTVLELAARVGPSGYVLGADVSKASVEKARERIAAAGVHQAEIMLCDVSTHISPANSFDLVFSRFGVMFFADPVATFANIRKAMKPDGRLALAVFRTPQENKWATAALAAPPVAAYHAAGSGGAGPVLMGRCSTRAPHFGNCGFSRRFLDTTRPSYAACWRWRSGGSGELYASCRPGGEGHERRFGGAAKRGAGSARSIFREP